MRSLWLALAGSTILVVSACSSASPSPSTTARSPMSAPSSDAPAVMAFPEGPSALRDMFADEFPEPLIDPREIISGGPPPDGIPPIDAPEFLDVSQNLSILPENEPVVALELNGDARAYPVRALVWHEIVNDTVGGVPVAITYCPLCNSAAVFERTINGAETSFGTSGRLFASALVMYDRATESLWTHYNGTSVVGMMTGTQLVTHAAPLLAWSDFRQAYPTGKILDWTRTGYIRDYGRNPYNGYDDPANANPFMFRGALDDRAAAIQRVVGISIGATSSAYTLESVSDGEGMATNTEVGESSLAIFWKSGQATALGANDLAEGRDVGSVGVFEATVAGQLLTFSFRDGVFVDDETGSAWSITGEALSGELQGTQLVRVPHLDTFWFAWSTYQPETTLITS